MSKSLGNVIAPEELVAKYGQDGTRWLLASLPVLAGDADITEARLRDGYTANLTNGLGNLASRLAKLASSIEAEWQWVAVSGCSPEVEAAMEQYLTSQAVEVIVKQVGEIDQELSRVKPWLMTDQEEKRAALRPLVERLRQIAYDVQIVMPETGEKLLEHFSGGKIEPLAPLWPRLQ